MLSLSFMDGYRTGVFTWNKKTASIPTLVKIRNDILYLGDITIERPTLYEKEVTTDLKTLSLLRGLYSTPEFVNYLSKEDFDYLQ